VPTSERTAAQARREGIPISDLHTHPQLAVAAFDGADEIDPHLCRYQLLVALYCVKKSSRVLLRSFLFLAIAPNPSVRRSRYPWPPSKSLILPVRCACVA
jgi:hypothetical protein